MGEPHGSASDDGQGWMLVTTSTTERPRKKPRLSNHIAPLAISNSYTPLSNVNEGDHSDSEMEEENSSTQEPPITNLLREKVPPIIISNISDYNKLIQKIKQYTTDHSFFLVARGEQFRLQLKNRLDYINLMEVLKNELFTFHTFSTPEEKLNKYVVRGLPVNCDTTIIKTELLSQGFKVQTVSQILKPTSEKTPLPLFTVTLKRTEDNNAISSLRLLYYHRVTVEIYRGSKGPLQCFRCQRFGHSNLFCQNITRCFKCAGYHESRACIKLPTVPCLCVNCDEAHPASYRKCEAYIRAMNNVSAPRHAPANRQNSNSIHTGRQQNTREPPRVTRERQHNLSYSNVASGLTNPTLQPPIHPQPQQQRSRDTVPLPQQNDIWSTIDIISEAIANTAGVPPTIQILLTMLVQLVRSQKPNGSSP